MLPLERYGRSSRLAQSLVVRNYRENYILVLCKLNPVKVKGSRLYVDALHSANVWTVQRALQWHRTVLIVGMSSAPPAAYAKIRSILQF